MTGLMAKELRLPPKGSSLVSVRGELGYELTTVCEVTPLPLDQMISQFLYGPNLQVLSKPAGWRVMRAWTAKHQEEARLGVARTPPPPLGRQPRPSPPAAGMRAGRTAASSRPHQGAHGREAHAGHGHDVAGAGRWHGALGGEQTWRRRGLIERTVAWLDPVRRLVVWYERLRTT